jgi:hypothetical protein
MYHDAKTEVNFFDEKNQQIKLSFIFLHRLELMCCFKENGSKKPRKKPIYDHHVQTT